MRLPAPIPSRSLLMWFGLLGGPGAWSVQHIFGFGITVAACNVAGRSWAIPVDTLTVIAAALAASIALLAEASALATYRATKDVEEDDAPPAGRVHFLAVVGLTVNPLFFFIIVMSGVGATVLTNCVQG